MDHPQEEGWNSIHMDLLNTDVTLHRHEGPIQWAWHGVSEEIKTDPKQAGIEEKGHASVTYSAMIPANPGGISGWLEGWASRRSRRPDFKVRHNEQAGCPVHWSRTLRSASPLPPGFLSPFFKTLRSVYILGVQHDGLTHAYIRNWELQSSELIPWISVQSKGILESQKGTLRRDQTPHKRWSPYLRSHDGPTSPWLTVCWSHSRRPLTLSNNDVSSTEHKGTPLPPRCTTAPRIIWPWEISLDGQSVLRVPVVQC